MKPAGAHHGSVFDLLDRIRQRPGMYVGGTDSEPGPRLDALSLLLAGYALAVHMHEIDEPVQDFPRAFGDYLLRTRDWSASCGPITAVRRAAKSDSAAWDLFFVLVDEFRPTVEPRSRGSARPRRTSARSVARKERGG